MQATIDIPDELLRRARSQATADGISFREFLIAAIERRLAPEKKKTRRPPPTIGDPDGPPIGLLSREQIDEAMFPIEHYRDGLDWALRKAKP